MTHHNTLIFVCGCVCVCVCNVSNYACNLCTRSKHSRYSFCSAIQIGAKVLFVSSSREVVSSLFNA